MRSACLQILRLGHEGYRKIMENLMRVAAHLAEGLLATGVRLLQAASQNCLPRTGWKPVSALCLSAKALHRPCSS